MYLSFSDLLGNCPNFSYKQYKSKSKWLCFYYLFKCQKKQERNHRTPFSLGSELTTEAQTSFENALLFQSIYKVHRKSIQTLRKSIHLCTVQQTWLNSFVLGLHFRTSSLQTHLGLKIIYGNLGTSPQSSIVLFSGQTYILLDILSSKFFSTQVLLPLKRCKNIMPIDYICTPKPRFSKPLFSKYLDLVNKLQLPFSYFTI